MGILGLDFNIPALGWWGQGVGLVGSGLGGLMVWGQPSTAPLKALPETTVPAWRLVGFHRPLDTALMEIFVTFLLTIQILFSSILPTHSKELQLSCLLLAVWESPSPF